MKPVSIFLMRWGEIQSNEKPEAVPSGASRYPGKPHTPREEIKDTTVPNKDKQKMIHRRAETSRIIGMITSTTFRGDSDQP